MKTKVYVVSFSPSEESPNAVGGFEWRFDRALAITFLVEGVSDPIGGPGYNWSLVEVLVPKGESITEYIDSNLQIIEPKGSV